jgi:hypothetical protein
MGLLKLSEMLGSVSEACKAIERMDAQLSARRAWQKQCFSSA